MDKLSCAKGFSSMTRVLMYVAVDGVTTDLLGVKEAASMLLEPLGVVHVLQVDVQEPEQMRMDGVAPARQTAAPAGQAPPPPSMSVPPQKKGRQPMACCLNCYHYQQRSSRDETGKLYWGKCLRTGKPVYDLRELCAGWKE